MFLYAKKLFFNKKAFDILDNFEKLVVKAKKTYYIYRSQEKERDSILMDLVANSMGLVLGEKGLDRRSYLYNRQGHKRIQIKKIKKMSEKYDKEKAKTTT